MERLQFGARCCPVYVTAFYSGEMSYCAEFSNELKPFCSGQVKSLASVRIKWNIFRDASDSTEYEWIWMIPKRRKMHRMQLKMLNCAEFGAIDKTITSIQLFSLKYYVISKNYYFMQSEVINTGVLDGCNTWTNEWTINIEQRRQQQHQTRTKTKRKITWGDFTQYEKDKVVRLQQHKSSGSLAGTIVTIIQTHICNILTFCNYRCTTVRGVIGLFLYSVLFILRYISLRTGEHIWATANSLAKKNCTLPKVIQKRIEITRKKYNSKDTIKIDLNMTSCD